MYRSVKKYLLKVPDSYLTFDIASLMTDLITARQHMSVGSTTMGHMRQRHTIYTSELPTDRNKELV